MYVPHKDVIFLRVPAYVILSLHVSMCAYTVEEPPLSPRPHQLYVTARYHTPDASIENALTELSVKLAKEKTDDLFTPENSILTRKIRWVGFVLVHFINTMTCELEHLFMAQTIVFAQLM